LLAERFPELSNSGLRYNSKAHVASLGWPESLITGYYPLMKILSHHLLWLVCCLFIGVLPPGALSEQVAVPLHVDLPDTLNSDQVSRLELFPDLTGVTAVWFEREAWGGIIAHILLCGDSKVKELERSIPPERWLKMQKSGAIVAAGGSPPSPRNLPEDVLWADPSSDQNRAWPEVPARNRELPEELQKKSGPRYPSLAGRWLVSGAVGYQHNVSSFKEYFTDMGVFHLAAARALNNNVIPFVGFTVGLGDLDADYEELVGDGRANNYSAMAGLMLRAPLSQCTSLYVASQGGFFGRSMQWGGIFTDPETGDPVDGHIRESGGWGFAVQMGLWRQKSHSRKARFFDFNVGLMWGEADPWQDTGTDVQFSAEGNDTWLMFTFRFWDQI